MRQGIVLLHRYVGLAVTIFLVIAGLTGSLLAFNHELEEVINPQLMLVDPPSAEALPLSPLVLRQRVQGQFPNAEVNYVPLRLEHGKAVRFHIEPKTDPGTSPLYDNEVFIDPYTGKILGTRKWGDITQGMKNLMPFIYRLHYTLALDKLGAYAMGIVALVWTIDCFGGLFLTLPVAARRGRDASSNPRKGWWSRWAPAWGLRWKAGGYRLNFDLHRAGALWTWAMLLVFAWSSVGFNLRDIYNPIMGTVFSTQMEIAAIPKLGTKQKEPGIDWPAALARGRELIAEESLRIGMVLEAEEALQYNPAKGIYRFRARTSSDIRDHGGSTSIYFDANTGERRAVYIPTGVASGDTVSTWIMTLHMGRIWGLPMQIFVFVMGLVVTLLSLTGLVIWLKKRRARNSKTQKTIEPAARQGSFQAGLR